MPVLLILRTPLQAWIAHSILQLECTTHFDVIYLTVNNNLEDLKSFDRISKKSNNSWYITSKPRFPDFLHQVSIAFKLKSIIECGKFSWEKIALASYDSHGINALATNQRAAEIVTFDDGTANINPNSKYSPSAMSVRERIYRRLLGGVSNEDFISRIKRHYTIFDSQENFLKGERLRLIDSPVSASHIVSDEVVRYFVGAPFEEVLSSNQLKRLKKIVASTGIDWIVLHPRQKKFHDFQAEKGVLDKQGEIAERAISDHADNREVWLFGWFSTVLFTMRPRAARRVMFLARDDARTPEMSRIAQSSGCEVVEF